jgi:hypothetical protein
MMFVTALLLSSEMIAMPSSLKDFKYHSLPKAANAPASQKATSQRRLRRQNCLLLELYGELKYNFLATCRASNVEKVTYNKQCFLKVQYYLRTLRNKPSQGS